MEISSLLSQYSTYSNKSSYVSPKLDSDDDGYWTRDDVQKYADAYKEATGNEFDVEALFKKYDSDKDGKINIAEKTKLEKDDALNMKNLAEGLNKEEKSSTSKSAQDTIDVASYLSGLIASGTNVRAATGLMNIMNKSETTSSLLSSLNEANGNSSDLYSILSQQNQNKILGIDLKYNSSSYFKSKDDKSSTVNTSI